MLKKFINEKSTLTAKLQCINLVILLETNLQKTMRNYSFTNTCSTKALMLIVASLDSNYLLFNTKIRIQKSQVVWIFLINLQILARMFNLIGKDILALLKDLSEASDIWRFLSLYYSQGPKKQKYFLSTMTYQKYFLSTMT